VVVVDWLVVLPPPAGGVVVAAGGAPVVAAPFVAGAEVCGVAPVMAPGWFAGEVVVVVVVVSVVFGGAALLPVQAVSDVAERTPAASARALRMGFISSLLNSKHSCGTGDYWFAGGVVLPVVFPAGGVVAGAAAPLGSPVAAGGALVAGAASFVVAAGAVVSAALPAALCLPQALRATAAAPASPSMIIVRSRLIVVPSHPIGGRLGLVAGYTSA
jgi:hypothetical protein